jgi:small subunit ribosomal protein S4
VPYRVYSTSPAGTGSEKNVDEALELAKQIGFPAWVDVAVDKAEGVFKKSPDRDEFAADINESLIVELYSR